VRTTPPDCSIWRSISASEGLDSALGAASPAHALGADRAGEVAGDARDHLRQLDRGGDVVMK